MTCAEQIKGFLDSILHIHNVLLYAKVIIPFTRKNPWPKVQLHRLPCLPTKQILFIPISQSNNAKILSHHHRMLMHDKRSRNSFPKISEGPQTKRKNTLSLGTFAFWLDRCDNIGARMRCAITALKHILYPHHYGRAFPTAHVIRVGIWRHGALYPAPWNLEGKPVIYSRSQLMGSICVNK